MGHASAPEPVLLILAVLRPCNRDTTTIDRQCESRFGATARVAGPLPFHFSSYYSEEMGENLVKEYRVYNQPIERAMLPEIKEWTNDIEAGSAVAGRRVVNLDPGYLSRDKLVLASTKDFYHRIFLDRGIYGEVTLHYRGGCFRHFSWTYPDYRQKTVLELLLRERARLVGMVRQAGRKKGLSG